MSEVVPIIDASEVQVGQVVPVQIGDDWFIVCNDQGTFHVTGYHCPHEHGVLGRGELHDGCIVCPVHHWPWDLKTGLTDPNLPHLRLPIYRCELKDGQVCADLSAPIPPDRLGIRPPGQD